MKYQNVSKKLWRIFFHHYQPSWDDKVEFGPETEVGLLYPTGDGGREEEGEGGGEGVAVGRKGGGREGGEVGEKDESSRWTRVQLAQHRLSHGGRQLGARKTQKR